MITYTVTLDNGITITIEGATHAEARAEIRRLKIPSNPVGQEWLGAEDTPGGRIESYVLHDSDLEGN